MPVGWGVVAGRGDGSMVVSFKASRKLVEAVDRARMRLGMNRSEFIREAILRYLADLGEEVEVDGFEEVGGGEGEVLVIVL